MLRRLTFRIRLTHVFSAAALIAIGLTLTASIQAQVFNGVSLKISNETVPAGGVLQMKLFLTEPKPIVKGSSRATINSSLITGIRGAYLYDPSGTTSGVAVLDSGGIRVSFTSPHGTLGTAVDYPLLTLALNLRSDLSVGSTAPLSLDLSSSFFSDALGNPYPQELNPGKLTVGGTLSVSNVVPGGGAVPAGGTVSIIGTGFEPTARLAINEVALSSYRVLSPTRIDAQLAAPATLDSKRVRVRTSEGTTTYYSYLRTTFLGKSSRPLLQASEPIFAGQTFTLGSLIVKQGGSIFSGLALQNPSTIQAVARVSLFTAQGALIARTSVTLPASTKHVRDVLELFPGAQPNDIVQITSNSPIQMLGLLADNSAGVVAPVTIGLR